MPATITRGEFDALFARHGPMVYRRAKQILGRHEDAEEIVQDVFIKALNDDSFRGSSSMSTWLYRVTTNLCFNRFRDSRRRRELLEEHGPTDKDAIAATATDGRVLVQRLLSRAEPQQARAAVYVYLDDLTHDEAAALMDVSRRTVGNLLERFNNWARETLEEK